MNALVRREQIVEFERRAKSLPQVAMPTKHMLVNGMYGREIFIPAGTIYVGKTHKTDHFFIILSGNSTMTTDDGVMNIEGPRVLTVKAGSKRMGVANTDCRFIAIHRTDQVELLDIEKDLTEFEPNSRYNVLNEIVPPKEDL